MLVTESGNMGDDAYRQIWRPPPLEVDRVPDVLIRRDRPGPWMTL
jgi:hypothetical protein